MLVEFLGLVKNHAEALTCLALVPAALFALWQWRKDRWVTRVEHLRQILVDVKNDDIARTFYCYIERTGPDGQQKKFYDGGLRISKGCEAPLDKMLMYFSLICHEHELGVINDSEFSYFSYQIHRALANEQIMQYLRDLSEYIKSCREHFVFKDLVREGMHVNRDFYEPLCRMVNEKSMFLKLLEKFKKVILWEE